MACTIEILLIMYQLCLVFCEAYLLILLGLGHIVTEPYGGEGDEAEVDGIQEVPLLGLDEHESTWNGFLNTSVDYLPASNLQREYQRRGRGRSREAQVW